MRRRVHYVCQSCGAVAGRWAGRCEACGAWNSLVEEAQGSATGSGRRSERVIFTDLSSTEADLPRLVTGLDEFDRVLGGGLVPGSAVLIGGDPGIGKSTLALQALARLACQGAAAVYVSGEESVRQVQLRARRLGLADAPVRLATATLVESVLDSLAADPPAALVVDSIQTAHSETLEAAAGSVGQIRAAAERLIRFAKGKGTALLLIGHVTKDGQIAGPKLLEHMVDTVLYFEGERGHPFRILRAVKNRFGPANELGVFAMGERGLEPVANPSALFLGERSGETPGCAVFAGIEGTRPVLVEVQALVAPSPLTTPRRAVVGWDGARLSMLLAVLEARCGLVLAGRDVYLNVAGGLRVQEPAADLAVAAAIVSALTGRALPRDAVVFGEVGLAGEVRAVGQVELRLREARKLGFRRAWMPPHGAEGGGLEVVTVRRLAALVRLLAGSPAEAAGSAGR